MSHADFIHLRVHSAYSLSEGAIQVKDLAKLCQDKSMPAVAVTDTNNLFGAFEFSLAAAEAGVQPIIGCQLPVIYGKDEPGKGVGPANGGEAPTAPMVFLAQNSEGYHNLLRLMSAAYLGAEDFHDPSVSLDVLEQLTGGVIALTGGPEGPVGRLLLDGQSGEAAALIERLSRMFSGNLYVEIMRHGIDHEIRSEPEFLDLAYKYDLPLVATNEVFFSEPDMYEAHDALVCIAAGAYVSQTERRRLTPEHRFKSAEEMRQVFADLPEAVDNTLVIAKRCAFLIETVAPILPPYDCGEGRSENDELKRQAEEGLQARLVRQIFTEGMSDDERGKAAAPYRRRLNYELGVIIEMGYPGYFLIVADFIHWAKDKGIPVGPGRGSGAGSVVAWALLITDLDPLRFGLLFERFLNPERVSMPDFDIDFCQDRRDEVIRYVQDKYGRDHVAQIITFGKLQARAVLRDVGRVLEMPYGYIDKICKLVPNNPASPVTLSEAIAGEAQLRQMISEDPAVKRLVDTAKRLEGLYRHASTHAAGVVIGDRPLQELIPLYRDPRSDMPVTGFNMKYVESAGLVKFDFLGLKTLTVLDTAERLVREAGHELDIASIPLDDAATYEMISRGETTGVFQLESSGMVDTLKKLRPDTFEDIIAVVALYRPGPMDNIPSYIRRKHGKEDPDYLYPTLEGILKETFGIMIYQEQVMQIAQELSGYSLGSADLLRRAMGKKIQSEMDEQRHVFVDGAKNKGVPEVKAADIFDLVNKFAGYGFNKSHAAAYALVAYQTAYMKAKYPVEFLAASMTLDFHNTDKINVFRQELKRMGIRLLPPDINKSDVLFSVERSEDSEPAIRYALAAVKNVGEGAMQGLVDERRANGPYADLTDFMNRLDIRNVNKRQLVNLARAGAFDAFVPKRRQMFEAVEPLMRLASAAQNERESGQIGLFSGDAAPATALDLPDVAEWPVMERLDQEFGALGFYLSAHPLDAFARSLERLNVRPSAEVIASGQSGPVKLAGTLVSKKERTSAKGNRYAFIQFTDASGEFEVTAFSESLAEAYELLKAGNSLLIRGAVQFEGDSARFTAQGFEPLNKAAADAAEGLRIVLESSDPLPALHEILTKKGKGRVEIISHPSADTEVQLTLPGGYSISPDVLLAVKSIPGIVDAIEI
jgi:DNA polymerase-3 subunit alpha